MEFSRQKYWSGLPFPFPGDPPDPRIKAMSPALAGRFFTLEPLGKPISTIYNLKNLVACSLQFLALKSRVRWDGLEMALPVLVGPTHWPGAVLTEGPGGSALADCVFRTRAKARSMSRNLQDF